MKKKAEKNISHVVDVGLKGILKILKIRTTSSKTDDYLKKSAKKIARLLKSDLKKQDKKKAKALKNKKAKSVITPAPTV